MADRTARQPASHSHCSILRFAPALNEPLRNNYDFIRSIRRESAGSNLFQAWKRVPIANTLCYRSRVATKFDRQNSRTVQGCFKDLFMIFKDVKTLRKRCVAALIRAIGAQCTSITLRAKSKDFKDDFQNSRTFQGYSKILNKIQGPFKDFKDWH